MADGDDRSSGGGAGHHTCAVSRALLTLSPGEGRPYRLGLALRAAGGPKCALFISHGAPSPGPGMLSFTADVS